MRINHNIAALNTYRQLSANTNNTSKSLEKLSSGLRINRAGDDAAGLAISEKMRSQIRGLDTASRNANDGISLIMTAEGALNETHSILQRMKELAVQSANDTNTDSDRAEIQKEIEQLTTEVTRISTSTEFNTKTLLDGTMASKATVQAGGGLGANDVTVTVAPGTPPADGTYTMTVNKNTVGGTPAVNASTANFVADGTGVTGVTIDAGSTYSGAMTIAVTVDAGTVNFSLSGGGLGAAVTGSVPVGDYGTATSLVLGDITLAFPISTLAAGDITFDATAAVAAGPGEVSISWDVADEDGNAVKSTAFELNFANVANVDDADAFDVVIDNSNATIFHIGANQGQNTSLTINKMDATSLGIGSLDLTSQAKADESISTIDGAISRVSSQRAALGAMQNRLEHTINNLGTASENLTAAESRIRDVDMAKEMMEFTKNNILGQASQAMLAQANMQPQSVLQLLQ